MDTTTTDTTTTDTPDLVASTGNNDSSSPWGVGLLQTALQGGIQLGQTALSGALQKQTPVNAAASSGLPLTSAAAPAPTPGSFLHNWGPWIVMGLIAAAAVWLLTRRVN